MNLGEGLDLLNLGLDVGNMGLLGRESIEELRRGERELLGRLPADLVGVCVPVVRLTTGSVQTLLPTTAHLTELCNLSHVTRTQENKKRSKNSY